MFWAKWSDALAAAGLERNTLRVRFDTADVLSQIVFACRHYGRVPTVPEMMLYRTEHPSFPSKNAIGNHFPTRTALIKALSQYSNLQENNDIAAMLPYVEEANETLSPPRRGKPEGSVYLLKSGAHYKIGRSDEIERRVKEIRIALPETVSLIHTIRTDDPPGIEAYWHTRFRDRRANGEWFKLAPEDVAAFKRRKYQ